MKGNIRVGEMKCGWNRQGNNIKNQYRSAMHMARTERDIDQLGKGFDQQRFAASCRAEDHNVALVEVAVTDGPSGRCLRRVRLRGGDGLDIVKGAGLAVIGQAGTAKLFQIQLRQWIGGIDTAADATSQIAHGVGVGVGPISLHDGTDSLLGGPLGLHDADALVVVVNANAEGDLDVVLADNVLVEAGEDLLRGGQPTLLSRLTGEVWIAAVLFLVRFLTRWLVLLLLLLLMVSAYIGSKSIAGERIAIGPHLGIVVVDMLHENIRLLLLDATTRAGTSGTSRDGILHDEPTAAGGAVEVVFVGKVVRMEDHDGRAARTAMTPGTAWAAWTSASSSRSGMRRRTETATDAMHGRTAMSSGGRGRRRRGNLVEILAIDTRILR